MGKYQFIINDNIILFENIQSSLASSLIIENVNPIKKLNKSENVKNSKYLFSC